VDRDDKIEKEGLKNLIKRSTLNTTIAWGLVWLSVALFINIKFSSLNSVFDISYVPIDAFYVLLLALLFKIESFHLFSVWKYDKKRLSEARAHFKNLK
jgi:hypothetical protein